jgi:predicted nuclease with TOPRIM domain
MINVDTESWLGILTIVGLATIAVFVGVQKILRDWKGTSAEIGMITLMHEELERMSQQNSLLSNELGNLNSQIINLRQELHNLTLENQRLHTEVVTLTNEVSRLQAVLAMGA